MLTNFDFLRVGQAYPPPSEVERINRCQENRLLFEGDHHKVYKENLKRLERLEVTIDDPLGKEKVKVLKTSYEILINYHQKISKLWADLLLGEPPRITPADKKNKMQQAQVDRILRKGKTLKEFYKNVIDLSRYGDGLISLRIDKQAILEACSPIMWLPVYDPANPREYLAHVLIQQWDEKGNNGEVTCTKAVATVHFKGFYEKYTLTVKNGTIVEISAINAAGESLTPDQWGAVGTHRIETKVDEFLVFPITALNTSDRIEGLDDYKDIDSLVSELEVRISQISKILDQHSDPAMTGDDQCITVDQGTGQAFFDTTKKFYRVSPDGKEPKYLVWDAQLEANFKHIEGLMEQLYIISETSPAAFGQLKQGLAESGSALKRLMMASLAKVNRIRLFIDPEIKSIFEVAAKLEKAWSVPESVLLEDGINIEWQDGLPKDETEQVTNEVQLKTAGLTSTRSALKRLTGLDGEALEAELKEIEDENPSVLSPIVGKEDGEDPVDPPQDPPKVDPKTDPKNQK